MNAATFPLPAPDPYLEVLTTLDRIEARLDILDRQMQDMVRRFDNFERQAVERDRKIEQMLHRLLVLAGD